MQIYPTIVKNQLHIRSDNDTIKKIMLSDVNGHLLKEVDDITATTTTQVSEVTERVYFVYVQL